MRPAAPEVEPRPERSSDIWRETKHPLETMFAPKSVALIGATESPGSVGRTVLENLKAGAFAGPIYPVNPKREFVLGLKSFPSISSIPEKVDLAVIVTPAATVPGIIRDCGNAGVPCAIIISAGFKEVGPAGVELERQILVEARRTHLRLIGPNCLGVMRPQAAFNATFAKGMARPGSVGFISQSGALCTAILDWSFRENVGFSAFFSLGSMLDVGWGDLIYYLGDDPHTRSIVMYMESIGDARSFLSAAREVALTKPIIVIKAGRTEAAAKAAASHTGSLTGSDEVLQAAFRRAGVLRVENIAELFDMAEVLGKQPRPKGPRLAIVTNAGGPGVLATDTLITSGARLADLSPETFKALDAFLPAAWSHNNPIDILGDAGADRYAKAVEIAANDPGNDGLLVILTPQAMTDATGTAVKLKALVKAQSKPMLASWMGAKEVETGEEFLNGAGIPTFKYPDRAARAFYYMWRYSDNLRALYETPSLAENSADVGSRRRKVESIIQHARSAGRQLLTEYESKRILSLSGIPTVDTCIARTADEAVRFAEKLAYPVVLKLHSEVITHKTDVGGVQLNLGNAAAVRRAFKTIERNVREKSGDSGSQPPATKAKGKSAASSGKSRAVTHDSPAFLGVTVQPMIKLDGYELILGSSPDPQFGPVLLFGTGGQLVEVFKDRALGLPPLNATLARRMIEQTKIYQALQGVRGRKPIDLAALDQLLVRFSQLVVEQPWIAEIDINPLLASPEGLIALDARIVVHGSKIEAAQLPRPAIRPYPTQYLKPIRLRDRTAATLRPIRPEDEPLLVKFHQSLSEESVYYRYFSALQLPQRTAHERLIRICFNDYDREIALVLDHKKPKTGEHEILAVGRLSKNHGTNEAEFALVVSDAWQNRGAGTELLRNLIQVGRNEKLDRIIGFILSENRAMQHLCRSLGFELDYDADGSEWKAIMPL
jgi:acetyltransferase